MKSERTPPKGPGEADMTAATFPLKGSVSWREHQSRVFFRSGVIIELYSGEAMRRAWLAAMSPTSRMALGGMPSVSSRSPW